MMRTQLLLLMICCASIQTFAQRNITMLVKENTLPCHGVAPMDCLQVKEGNDRSWSNFYNQIEGFDYQPGYEYKLSVTRMKRTGNIPADAPAYTYRLRQVIYKRKVQSVDASFLSRKMILTSIHGKNVTGANVYLTIDNTRERMFGKSGCNTFNAGCKLSGNSIQVGALMGTMMACDAGSMKLEQTFRGAIENKTFSIHAEGNKILFKDTRSGKAALVFTIPSAQDIWSFIDGKNWKLIQMDHTGMDFGKAMIRFDAKTKKVSGNSGCNNFSGAFTTRADELSFSVLAGTKMACPDKNITRTERSMLGHLSGATLRFDVAEQTLNLYKGDELVLMFGIVK